MQEPVSMLEEGEGVQAGGTRLSDLAYSRILQILFEKRLPAGAFVSQKELVDLTGVPIAPLRDSLRVLETEGILTIHPRSGIEFVKPGLELTRATYQFRAIIESAAVAVYAETADEGEIVNVAARHLLAIKAVETEGLSLTLRQELDALEVLLHHAIVASVGNALIETSYRRIHNYLRLVRLDRNITAPLVLRSLREHMAIIEACRRRDAAAAVKAIQAHLAAALERNLGL